MAIKIGEIDYLLFMHRSHFSSSVRPHRCFIACERIPLKRRYGNGQVQIHMHTMDYTQVTSVNGQQLLGANYPDVCKLRNGERLTQQRPWISTSCTENLPKAWHTDGQPDRQIHAATHKETDKDTNGHTRRDRHTD